jgi:hypothetical protein
MNKYMGFKLIEAEPAWRKITDYGMCGTSTEIVSHEDAAKTNKDVSDFEDGYSVKYPDGYTSWSPKEVFAAAYIEVINNPKLASGVSVSKEMVDNFIKDVKVQTIGEKTTLVIATLINGFEIIESSSCADKANYNEEMGKNICMDKIKDKIWDYLGFLLNTAANGIK